MGISKLFLRGLGLSLFALDAFALPPTALAEEWFINGSFGIESRLFVDPPEFTGQDDIRFSPSVHGETEIAVAWNGYADEITIKPFGRYDADDSRRSHVDLREANWLHTGAGWDLLIGLGQVFWGVAESRHLVDIINQTDLVEDIDEEEKLGQPMVAVTLERNWGALRLFMLPGFRERTFPADNARLRGPTPISREPTYDSSAENRHVDFAARWSQVIGNLDIGLAHFHGTSREPRLPATLQPDLTLIRIPHYDQIDQTSFDAQITTDATLWKLEAMTRSGQGKRFGAAVAGLEHTLFDVDQNGADLGLLAEYLYDGRENDDQNVAPTVALQDDVFVGLRFTLNDEHDSAMLLGAFVDRKNGSKLVSIESERRIGDFWKAEVEGRLFYNVADGDPLAALRSDGFIRFRLSRFF